MLPRVSPMLAVPAAPFDSLEYSFEVLGTNISLPTMHEATMTLGTKRSVCLLGQPGEYYSEEALFSSLRHFIPANLADDVRIGTTSWNK